MSSPGVPMPWWKIIVILLGVALVVGVCLGILSSLTNMPIGWATAGVGAATGVVGAMLISRRNNA